MAFWDCPFCKNAIDEGEQKCPHCSKSIRCLFCNTVQRLQRTATKCEKCTKSLLEAPRVPVPLASKSSPLCVSNVVASPTEVLAQTRKQAGVKSGTLFVDPDFPIPKVPGVTSTWASFHDLKDMSVFGKGEGHLAPHDALQGNLGDCWLISVMALLAHHKPSLLYDLFVTKERTDDGMYAIKLWIEGIWVTVVVDSFLPTNKGLLGRDSFVYAHSQPGTTCWAALLEKAVAKVTGGYDTLVGGQATEAFLLLTGLPTFHYDRDDRTVEWSANFLTSQIVGNVGRGEFVAATCTSGEEVGLSKDHVYSVLAVNGDHGELLLQLRNPWGVSRYTGVTGPNNAFTEQATKMEEYRKSDELIKAVTAVLCPAAALGQAAQHKVEQECKDIGDRAAVSRAVSAPDGVFWMPLSRFVSSFSDLYICISRPGATVFTEPALAPRVPRNLPTDDELKRMVIHVKSQTTISVFCSQRSARIKDTVYADMMVCVCPISDPSKKSGGGLFSSVDYTQITATPQLSHSGIHQTVHGQFTLQAGIYVVFPISVQCKQQATEGGTSSAIHMSIYAPQSGGVVSSLPISATSFLHLIPSHVICRAVKQHPSVLAEVLQDVTLYTLWRTNICITVAVYKTGIFGGAGTAKITTDFKGTSGMVFVPKGRKSCTDVPADACAVLSVAVVAAHKGKYQFAIVRDIEAAFSKVKTKVSASSENDLLAPVKIKDCF